MSVCVSFSLPELMQHQIIVFPCRLFSAVSSQSLIVCSFRLLPTPHPQPLMNTFSQPGSLYYSDTLNWGCDFQVLRLTLAGWNFHLEVPQLYTWHTWKNKYWSPFRGCVAMWNVNAFKRLWTYKAAIITTIIIRYKISESISSLPFILMISASVLSARCIHITAHVTGYDDDIHRQRH